MVNGSIQNNNHNSNQIKFEQETNAYDRFQKYWWLIRRKLWLVVLFSASFAIYKYNEILKIKEIFSSVSTVILDGSSTDRAVALLGIPGARYGYQNEQYILKSDKLAKQVAQSLINGFNTKQLPDTLDILKGSLGTIANVDLVARRLQSRVRFVFEEENNIIRIQATAFDPVEASKLANAYAQTYREFNINQSRAQILETKDFLQKKITESSDSLISLEFQILDFYKDNAFTNYDISTENTLGLISELYKQADNVRIEQVANLEEIKAIDSTLKYSRTKETDFLVNATDNFIQHFNDKIIDLELQKEEQLTQLNNIADTLNPTIKVINDKLKIYKDKLTYYVNQKLDNSTLLSTVDGSIAKYWIELNARKLELQNKNKTYPYKIKKIEEQISIYQERLRDIPYKRLEIEKLEQKKVRLTDAVSRFSNRYMDMELAEASEGGYVKLLDAAKPNYSPLNKQTTAGVMQGFFYGALLAIGLIIGLDRIDDRIKSDDDLATMPVNIVSGIPSMESLIQKEFQGKKFVDYRDSYISTKLLATLLPLSGIAEMYRRLRSDFLFSLPDKSTKSILISSANPQEGKSVSASNLSIVLAQSGKKVLLVDADLRRPNVEVLFGLSHVGLADYIIGNAQFDDIIIPSVVENLNIVTAGSQVPNPGELLGSEMFKTFYYKAMQEYDFVIIDSPPINSVVDAVAISELIDLILIVVRAGKTKKKELRTTLQILSYVQNKMKGILLNDINQKSFITDYNYYNNYN
ncbi:polysaccharide biosynthesis tyrosine autokinase, partial [bacterium]